MTAPKTDQDEQLFNARELAGRLSMKLAQVRTLTRQGTIPVIKLGHRTHRYSLPSVMAALKKLEVGS